MVDTRQDQLEVLPDPDHTSLFCRHCWGVDGIC
jgi:hypothetical protein